MKTPTSKTSTWWFISKGWDLSLLALIVAVGALLRLPGISHGIGFHPDERHMVMVTEALERNGMNPKSFAYGSFSFYAAWGFAQLVRPFSDFLATYDGLFYSGRSFCAVMGTITIALSYYLAVLVYQRSLVGLIAASLMACNVFHLQLSRFFTSDITLTTLSLISIIALVKAHQRETLWSFLVFGFCAGLATATKISSVFLSAPLLLVVGLALIKEWPKGDSSRHALRIFGIVVGGLALLGGTLFLTYWKGYPRILKHRVAPQAFLIPLSIPFMLGVSLALRRHSLALSKLFACLSMSILIFAMAEPFAILDFETFIRQTREQTSMVRGIWRAPYTVQYEGTAPYFYHLKQMLWYTMGWPVFTTVAIGVVFASLRVAIDLLDKVLRRELATKPLASEMIPLAFVAVFFLATGYFQVKFPRYLLPLYPMLFIFAAALFGSIVKGVQSAPAMASPVVPPERSEKQVSSKALLAPVDVSACEVSVELPRSDARPEDSSD
jgi:4-amino-4-deoxy-L-arabinose transferase-like glycosyltransferase